MTDEKLFQFLISRVSTRESISLALSGLTSSASLVLIALFFLEKQELPILAIVLGLLFPLMAWIHIEISYHGIHKHDHKWIRQIIKENNDSNKDTEKILRYTKFRKVRLVLIRFIFALPLFGWYFVLDIITKSNYILAIILSIITGVIILAIFRLDKIKDLDEKEEQKPICEYCGYIALDQRELHNHQITCEKKN